MSTGKAIKRPLAEPSTIFNFNKAELESAAVPSPAPLPALIHLAINSEIENTKQLGLVLYTDFFIYFQLAGIVLLIAMIGAIVLTHQRRKDVKRQDILSQIYKDPDSSIELKDIKPGQGL